MAGCFIALYPRTPTLWVSSILEIISFCLARPLLSYSYSLLYFLVRPLSFWVVELMLSHLSLLISHQLPTFGKTRYGQWSQTSRYRRQVVSVSFPPTPTSSFQPYSLIYQLTSCLLLMYLVSVKQFLQLVKKRKMLMEKQWLRRIWQQRLTRNHLLWVSRNQERSSFWTALCHSFFYYALFFARFT